MILFSDLERLNKYIDQDLEKEKEKDNLQLSQEKTKELQNKKKELQNLKKNLDNPGIFTNLANLFSSEETIAQNREY